jgi:hypothetical protein
MKHVLIRYNISKSITNNLSIPPKRALNVLEFPSPIFSGGVFEGERTTPNPLLPRVSPLLPRFSSPSRVGAISFYTRERKKN